MGGLAVTGMNNGTSWGLYIACFMFFVGLSAGGLIVASSASVFHIAQYKKVALPAIICSTVCICLAGMFVLIDLGGVQRRVAFAHGPNFHLAAVLGCVRYHCATWLLTFCTWCSCARRGRCPQVEIVSRFALPVAILVHSVTAWIFGLQLSREWYSAIMAPAVRCVGYGFGPGAAASGACRLE